MDASNFAFSGLGALPGSSPGGLAGPLPALAALHPAAPRGRARGGRSLRPPRLVRHSPRHGVQLDLSRYYPDT